MLVAKIIQEAKGGDMPPLQYLLLHWDAKLSKADVQTISMLGRSAGSSEAALGGAGDAARGKAVFEKRCTGCHAMEADREGPRLAGVFGRSRECAWVYVLGRTEEFGVDVDGCNARKVVERSGHGGAGQQHELWCSKGR